MAAPTLPGLASDPVFAPRVTGHCVSIASTFFFGESMPTLSSDPIGLKALDS